MQILGGTILARAIALLSHRNAFTTPPAFPTTSMAHSGLTPRQVNNATLVAPMVPTSTPIPIALQPTPDRAGGSAVPPPAAPAIAGTVTSASPPAAATARSGSTTEPGRSASTFTSTDGGKTSVSTTLVPQTRSSASPPCGGCVYYVHMSLTTLNLQGPSPAPSVVLSDYRVESRVTAASACQASLVSSVVLGTPRSFALPPSNRDAIVSSIASTYIASHTIRGCGGTPSIQLLLDPGVPTARGTPASPGMPPAGPLLDEKTIIGISVGVATSVLLAIGFAVFGYFLRRRRREAQAAAALRPPPIPDMVGIVHDAKRPTAQVRSLRPVELPQSRSQALVPIELTTEASARQRARELDHGYRGAELRTSPPTSGNSSSTISLKPPSYDLV